MDAATSLYDSLTTEAEIESLAKSTPEKEHLEFKERSQPNKPLAEDKGTRADIAEALSGFANSAGGVLVIGVDDKTGDLRPMPNLVLAEKQLHRELSTAVYPPVIGATAKRIPTALDPNAGYLVLLVPESEEGPHQAQMKGKKLYFTRAGESFVQMHHKELELRFGRPPKPVLTLRGTFRLIPNEKTGLLLLEGFISLVNSGRGVAHNPMLQVIGREPGVSPRKLEGREPHFDLVESSSEDDPAPEFWSRPRICVYPDHAVECCWFDEWVHPEVPEPLIDPVFVIEARIYAENMRATTRRLRFTRELYRKLGPRDVVVRDEPL